MTRHRSRNTAVGRSRHRSWYHPARWFICLILLLALTAESKGTTDRAVPQFTRTTWRVQDGLPENTVQAIQQASSGQLWIGTTGGGVWFDGAHFSSLANADGSIFSMLAAKDGSLWLGTEGSGLLRFHDGAITAYSAAQGLTDGFVRTILEDHRGRIWVGTDGGLFWINHARAREVSSAAFGQQLSVHGLMEDADGRIWVGGSKLLGFPEPADPADPQDVTVYPLPGVYSENRIKCMLQTRDHTVWVGTVGGLDRLGVHGFERVPAVEGTVRTMLQTADGLLWVGTIGHGLYVHRPTEGLSRIGAEGQGAITTVLALFEDDSHQLWIGSQDGLFRMRRTPVRVVPLPGDTPPDFATLSLDRGSALWAVSSRVYHIEDGVAKPATFPGLGGVTIRNILRDRAGTLWFGTDGGGVYHQTPAGLVHYLAPQRLVNNFVRAFLEASDGTMWVATDEGVSRIHGEHVENLRMNDGLAYFSTRSLLEDRHRDVWIGTERGLSHWHAGQFLNDALTEALAHDKVWSMMEASDGSLWFGTRDRGVYRQAPSGLTHFTTAQGLVSDSVYAILEGPGRRIWISGPAGLSSFSADRLTANGRDYLATTSYDLPDSSSGTQMYGGRQPSGVLDAHGAIWFPSTRGAVQVTEVGVPAQQLPRVEITGVLANGQPLDLAAAREYSLPPSLSRLEISFAPLLIRPQAGVRFRYRMTGFDSTWIDAGASRTAVYTNLPAAQYRFDVQVFDAARPDRTADATLAFEIRRHFYATLWFLALSLFIAALLAWSIYAGHLRQIRLRFAAVLDERSRLAREMHDTVIQGCTGISALLEAMASLDAAKQPLREDLLDHARTQVRSTIDEARQAVWNLRNNTQLCKDLPARLERLAAQVQQDFATSVVCRSDGPNLPIADTTARELLMVVREAVYNAALHGAPTSITVRLKSSPEAVLLEVRDDGAGFDLQRAGERAGLHYGISGMRERVERMKGEFTLESGAGTGTIVRAQVRREHLQPSHSEKVLS